MYLKKKNKWRGSNPYGFVMVCMTEFLLELMNEMNENILGKSDCLKEYLGDTSKGNY